MNLFLSLAMILAVAFVVLCWDTKSTREAAYHFVQRFIEPFCVMNIFPNVVNTVQAPAVAGDFCSSDPRGTVDFGPGGAVAGPNGLTIGLFAWADANNLTVSNAGAGLPTGFVHREQQALITTFLADSGMVIPAGLHCALTNWGDVWVKNAGATAAAINQKAYVNNATGAISFAATGSPTQGGTSTASTIAVNTSSTATIALNSVTGSISGAVLTVTAVGSGALFPGQTLSGGSSGTGYVDPATTIVAQLTGTTGSTGTYSLSVAGAVTSTTITGSGGMFTVSGVVVGIFVPGQTLSGGSIAAGTTILRNISGTGGAGTYAVNIAQTIGATATTGSGSLLTIGGTVTGVFALFDLITGSGVTAGSTIQGNASTTSNLTGAGGAGTYWVTAAQTLTSQAINVNSTTETKWYAASAGAAGELVKMTSYAPG